MLFLPDLRKRFVRSSQVHENTIPAESPSIQRAAPCCTVPAVTAPGPSPCRGQSQPKLHPSMSEQLLCAQRHPLKVHPFSQHQENHLSVGQRFLTSLRQICSANPSACSRCSLHCLPGLLCFAFHPQVLFLQSSTAKWDNPHSARAHQGTFQPL